MSYGPTNPRPLSDIKKHPYWRKGSIHPSYLTNAINRSQKKSVTNPRIFRKYFYTTDSHKCQSAHPEGGTSPKVLSSYDIFKNPTILPYYISSQEQANIPPTQRSKWISACSKYRSARSGRTPTLYRITDFTYCDDLGRFYQRSSEATPAYSLLEFVQYTLTKSADYRNPIWIRGPDGDVSMSAYIAIGYAGYNPSVQQRMYSSLKFDVHHIDENKFDVTPSTVVPLPTWMHLRWVHASDHSTPQKSLFKKTGKYIWE